MKKIMKLYKINILLTFLLIFAASSITAQSVRGLINDGVKDYKNDNFSESEIKFRKSIEKEEKFEGFFNLGDALYKQERYDEALTEFQASLEKTENPVNLSQTYYNSGNTF